MSRVRSNALTGPSDSRSRSPAEIALFAAFKTPIPVAGELDTFLKKIFADKNLMETLTVPGDIADGIYNYYSSAGGGVSGGLTQEQMLQAARRNWTTFKKVLSNRIQDKAFFQYTKNEDGEMVTLNDPAIFADDELALEAAEDFLYFGALHAGPAACRVYLNLAFKSMPKVVDVALHLTANLRRSIVDLKTTGPGAGRADSVVIYCTTTEKARAVAESMSQAITKGTLTSEDQSVPAMTTRIGPGVSIGAEPRPQETGLGYPIEGYPPNAQSFGSIRSQIITAAILNYRVNTDVLGSGYDVFKQLAAIGFKGYGLDPASPGS